MENQISHTEKLFSYGTLQYENVQISTFGRKLNGKPDILKGYRLLPLKITDIHVVQTSGEDTHYILTETNNEQDEVKGMVFDLSSQEIEAADKYEVEDYLRVKVKTISGEFVWVYKEK